MELPKKKYKIIYADPPWKIGLFSKTVRPLQKEFPYKQMSLEEIKNLPIKDIVDKSGCHLFLWTTQSYLPFTFEIIEAWGFKYHCTLTWNKTFGFVPFSFMWSTEFCLYAQLKNKWIKPAKFGIKTLITEKPKGHSRKPDLMRKLILEYAGDLPRIELFARDKIEGWDVFGDEVPKDTQKILK